MSIPYVVRKKADLSSGERKELWYGVPSKMQRRGGVKNKELAVRMAKTTGFHRGQIVQSPNQKIPDRKTKCVIKTHINIKQNVIFGAKLKPV